MNIKLLFFLQAILFAVAVYADEDSEEEGSGEKKCGKNAEESKCASPCQPTCYQPFQNCTYDCVTGCVCKKDHIRESNNGQCIKKKDCPKVTAPNPTHVPTPALTTPIPTQRPTLEPTEKPLKCKVNQIYEKCSDNACKTTCENKDFHRNCPEVCIEGCSCVRGFVWNNELTDCIPLTKCPRECKQTQVWQECSDNNCKRTCANKDSEINCDPTCVAGCSCIAGYVWNDNLTDCVPECDCPQECPENQEWNECGSPCKKNCSNYNDTTACTLPCHSGCFCKEGHVWNRRETKCKPVTSCPNHCDLNQVWEECSDNACKTTCGNRNVYKSCPTCIEGCSCKPGFVWNDELTGCVPERECPYECEHNQVWETCSDNACKKTCENKDVSVVCPAVCIAGCSCKNGSVWNKDLTKCMPVEECPQACGEHQVWQGCSDYLCRRTCDSLNVTISCPTVCIPGCSCEEGYVWNKEFTKCIAKDSCPHQCDKHQVWEECSDVNCKRTCANMDDDSYVCNKPCEPGCSCQPGYIWNNQENQCILSCDCAKANCGPNEKWSECAKLECRGTCQRNKTRNCGECQSGCICEKGYIWDENIQQCVLKSECSPECGENEEWSLCTSPCERTCQGPGPGHCTDPCVPGCACKGNSLRDLYQRKCVLISDCSQACEHPKIWCKHVEPNQVTCQNMLYPRCVSSDYFQQILYPGCICPMGYVLNEVTHNCVTINECFNTTAH